MLPNPTAIYIYSVHIDSLEVAREEKNGPMIFNFRIKHFPESISEELIQLPTLVCGTYIQSTLLLRTYILYMCTYTCLISHEYVQHLFYLEMKESILEDKMYRPVAAAILLSSLAVCVSTE